jgi:hypothetical protein
MMTSDPTTPETPPRMACAVGKVIDLVSAAQGGAPMRMTMLRRPSDSADARDTRRQPR